MSTYRDCQSVYNNFGNIKMDSRDDTADTACLSPSTASPPDLDFNLPCRFFKSTFARSLSLNNSSYSSSSNQCKSLDYDMRSNNNNNKLSCFKRDTTAVLTVQPLPQRRLSQAGSFYQQNEVNKCERKQVFDDAAIADDREKPPALPARRPLSLHNMTLPQNLSQTNAEQKFQQTMLTQLRQQAYKQSTNNSNGNNNNNNNFNVNENCVDHATGLQLLSQQPTLSKNPQSSHLTATTNANISTSNNSNNNNCNSNSINNSQNNLSRNSNDNHIGWVNQQKNVEQNCNICIFDQVENENVGDELNSNYHDATKLSTVNDYNNHFHNSHQMLHMIPTINFNSKSQQLGNNQQQQQQISSYDILNDNSTNVEAVILQNQVDTLQWQLKQVETSCDMYRAVMEEVARFLERYQSQKQLQQQQQQQQMATQKHYNNSSNSKMEQISRSKSLFQVYTDGGHEKNGNSAVDERTTTLSPATSNSTSYLRARSSTNLIDLKHQQSNATCNGRNKDEYIFETGITPSQSYSAFKDFTWRRSPKKPDSHLNIAKDDSEEKLNQEAFRLLRTIQNLLNTSQHKPDLAQHRHSLATVTASKMASLSKAMSTTSVMTLPGLPVLNSTSLNTCSNSDGGSTKSDDTTSTTSPTITSVNNAVSNNLAPEVLFLRSTNMRDSRLSLRSSTDSSVHSTSSAASSVSSKVETDEEPSTPFLTASNTLPRKQQQQQQHQHLAGSSTEDESGFSSISSFPDIGISLSSTMLSNAPHSSHKNRTIGKELKALKANERDLQSSDSRNSTLKANVVGLPLNTSQDMSHRWDSPSKTYHNASNKFQRFSALTNEDSNTVLWV